jgi:hypothetical protein
MKNRLCALSDAIGCYWILKLSKYVTVTSPQYHFRFKYPTSRQADTQFGNRVISSPHISQGCPAQSEGIRTIRTELKLISRMTKTKSVQWVQFSHRRNAHEVQLRCPDEVDGDI